MPSPSATPTPITPPRVPLIDERTGLIDRAWYMFFLSLFQAAQTVDAGSLGSDAVSLIASYDQALRTLAQSTETQPSTAVNQIEQQLDTLRQEVQTQRLPELGSMAPLEQDNVPWLTFNLAPSPVPTAVGSMYWDGGTTMGIQATSGVLIRVGEAEYVYAKASAAITKGQLCYHTGAVGASGVITVAPTPLALVDPNQIVGVAAESILLNGFGLIQVSGDLRGFNTTGSSVGETWADGDPLYYNPAYVGSMTKVKPVAPNQKTYIGEVINAATAGSGSMSIRIVPGSTLGGTDSNVQFGALSDGDLVQYDSTVGYWKNVPFEPIVPGVSFTLTTESGDVLTTESGDPLITELSGGYVPTVKTTDFTVATGELWLINDKSGSTCTVTLPTPSAAPGRVLHFQNYQAQTLVSASSNVVPLAGGSAGTAILAATAGVYATLVSNGTSWLITQKG